MSQEEANAQIATFVREVATLKDTDAGRAIAKDDPGGMLDVLIAQARELVALLPQ